MRPQLNNILIVDDNKDDLELAQYHLNKHFEGLMYMVAGSKKDFEEKYTWLKPDLIISDFDLPDCTGLELLIQVRENHKDIPFIFMSGTLEDNDDSLSKTILNGANGYVLKDNIHKLPEIISHVMENEYAKREELHKKEMLFTKVKLKLAKSIEMLKSGADTDSIINNLSDIKNKLENV